MSVASLLATATRLINKNGAATTLRNFPAGAENATKPWRPTESVSTDYTGLKMAFLPYAGKPVVTYADGTVARMGDMVVYLSAENLPAQPDVGSHLIRADGSVWAIKALTDYEKAGVRLLYELWVRR